MLSYARGLVRNSLAQNINSARGNMHLSPAVKQLRKSARKRADRAMQRLAYGNAISRDIQRFKKLQARKLAGEILSDEDFDWMMQFAIDHANQEYEYLHEPFQNSPPTRRSKHFKRSKPRVAARTRTRLSTAEQAMPRRLSDLPANG